jgi:excinuclease UvrABC helicase subunit UvrB
VPEFEIASKMTPKGDQPQAIDALTARLLAGERYSTLLGVTGSGKTFTVANVVARVKKPTLVVTHNKTLAAQLYSEFKDFFPRPTSPSATSTSRRTRTSTRTSTASASRRRARCSRGATS